MSINQLILRNLKKNIKHYYLYVFALIFSVALYFSFVTLQFDPSMDTVEGTIKGSAAIQTTSVILIAIIAIFLLYANNIFIKRRSKEIGLFQLIGLTKQRVFVILTAENLILYFCSLLIGVFVGFSISKFITMILFKLTGVDSVASMSFSINALIQSILIFSVIYLLIMLMNYIFIKRQNILSLFKVTSSTEDSAKKISIFEVIIGAIGLALIITGYYTSSQMFNEKIATANQLFLLMIFILASVIIGTYLFYKGSVRLIFHVIRKKKDGYLNINQVLSLSSIMFRMKSNALVLTIITTVSALAIGLLSLSYISYYSIEKQAKETVPADFALHDINKAQEFKEALINKDIPYSETEIEVVKVHGNFEKISETLSDGFLNGDPKNMVVSIISDTSVKDLDVSPKEAVFYGLDSGFLKILGLEGSGEIELKGQTKTFSQNFSRVYEAPPISLYFTGGGMLVGVVDHTIFKQLKNDQKPDLQREHTVYVGIDIKNKDELKAANELFIELHLHERYNSESRIQIIQEQKQSMGLTMFIVAYLGLAFLVTSGCILYFKQMDESESEKPNYTILRKLGFTQHDLLKGIQLKQVFNFGIPLVVGLLHSYFAVKSGWFFFGTELWTPMIIVMLLYTALYSIFGILSVLYYKKVINSAL